MINHTSSLVMAGLIVNALSERTSLASRTVSKYPSLLRVSDCLLFLRSIAFSNLNTKLWQKFH